MTNSKDAQGRAGKPGKTDKPDKTGKSGKLGKPDKSGKPDRPNKKTSRAIDKALDKAEEGLAKLDSIHQIGSHATGHERLAQAAQSSALLSSVWSAPPAERLRYNPEPTTRTTDGPIAWTLETIQGGETPGFHGDKSDGERFIHISSTEIARYQRLLYANGAHSATSTQPADIDTDGAAADGASPRSNNRLLIVLQGMDASGKGGIVKHVFRQGNPMGIHYHGFGAPSEEETSHDFLWRVKRELPQAGWIGVFDRSHYEDVVMCRRYGAPPRSACGAPATTASTNSRQSWRQAAVRSSKYSWSSALRNSVDTF